MATATADEVAALGRRATASGSRCATSRFALPAGATVAVFGANGAGKTTLLRILATLLRPHAGAASVLGAALPREAWKVRGRIGLLGHEPLLYRDLTVRENLRFHARLHGVRRGARGRAARARRAAPRAPTTRCARSRAAWPSAPRSAARVLHAPDLLLLDEPLANLDPGGARAVAPLIGAGRRARVLISHDVEQGLARGRLGARAARRPPGDLGAGRRGDARRRAGAVRVRRDGRRADPQGPAARAALVRVGAGDADVHRLDVRAVPLRARPRARSRATSPPACSG